MAKVVLSSFAMIDPETYREVLDERVDEPVEIEVADLGSAERVTEAAAGADAVVTDINTPVTAEALAALDLRVVVRSAVGVDNIDVGAAADEGVTVTRVPDYCTDEVATHSVSLLFACLRSLKSYDDAVANGTWSWESGTPIRRVSASTVGLLSFGPIARHAAEQLSGFGADLVGYDPFVEADEMADYGVEKIEFETLFDRAAAELEPGATDTDYRVEIEDMEIAGDVALASVHEQDFFGGHAREFFTFVQSPDGWRIDRKSWAMIG